MVSNTLARIFVAKASRVFASGLLSVMTPIYLDLLGYSSIYIGVFVLVIVSSNVFSNLLLSRYEGRFGRRSFVLLFSGLMVAAGLLLFLTTSTALLLLAFFIGNISTTGTEAGPFQSVEAGVLPSLVAPARLNRLFGVYNVLGYGAASIGALAASAPGYLQNSLSVFRLLYLLYALIGLMLFVLYLGLRDIEAAKDDGGKQVGQLSAKARKDIAQISALYSVDAFGGSFVTQSLLTYWFFLIYHVSLADLGIIFFVVNVITAISIFAASLIAERFGNLRTMVATHLISSIFLTVIPFAGSLTVALLLFFLRQSVSQMDVPTRQVFMAELFDYPDLVRANARTNTFRSVGSLFGGPISGALYAAGYASLPILTAGLSKIIYDLAIYSTYRKEAK
jgi:predicted MFS family arabinose efflux permease